MTNTEQELFEERAAILEYDAGFSREEAEKKAREIVGAYGIRPNGGLDD